MDKLFYMAAGAVVALLTVTVVAFVVELTKFLKGEHEVDIGSVL